MLLLSLVFAFSILKNSLYHFFQQLKPHAYVYNKSKILLRFLYMMTIVFSFIYYMGALIYEFFSGVIMKMNYSSRLTSFFARRCEELGELLCRLENRIVIRIE